MKIYSIKVALHGVSPMIWRRLRIAGNTSLASLHYIIQITQGWDDEHLHQFHIYGKDYGISYSGGLSFGDNAYKVYIDDFKFDVGDRFTIESRYKKQQNYDGRSASPLRRGVKCGAL
ncbi:plasmid pRiA4b ORF-3 family protein [Vibrio sp. S9_S30]|uniref:plasmid pRiA4b ORF-3 family protein n=1 Tax=Vibrio sp. S9_S30 TaxID=2720226 RepID=UPI001933EB21|nr:plasmid pRiA4b ORF-3 family protein [Vibrio sp. S9_S30]MBD1559802.1 plasmid pRiA4b ORF-3 family protein [Vibrio sp. S9_S30]